MTQQQAFCRPISHPTSRPSPQPPKASAPPTCSGPASPWTPASPTTPGPVTARPGRPSSGGPRPGQLWPCRPPRPWWPRISPIWPKIASCRRPPSDSKTQAWPYQGPMAGGGKGINRPLSNVGTVRVLHGQQSLPDRDGGPSEVDCGEPDRVPLYYHSLIKLFAD